MAHVARVPLAAQTLAKKWYLDVNTGTYASPVWTPVNGVGSLTPAVTQTTQDNSDYDGDGWGSDQATAEKWAIDLKLARKVTVADETVYDPGQEALRTVADDLGIDNRVDVRWYEVNTGGPKVEAYRGFASVSWSEDGGGYDALSTVTAKLGGQGARTAITHPDSEAAHVPVVSSITPATAGTGGGQVVEIYGQYFTGVTACKVGAGGTAFTSYYKIDDCHILGVLPAKAANTYVIEVTNAAGVSSGGATVTYS